ncbi:MAG: transglutaminase-like domain-containing protein [Fimbriiglobus sp.]
MALRSTAAVRVATLVLMGVAYVTCEIAAYPDGRPRAFGVGFGLVAFVLACLAAWRLRPTDPAAKPSRRMTVILAGLLVLPMAVEPLLRAWVDEGFPLEMQLVNGLRILGLSLAGLSAWPKLRRLAGVVALFLALFSSAMGDQAAIPYLLVVFALSGGLWLVLEHQSSGHTTSAYTEGELSERVELKMPYREAIVFGVLAIFAGAVALAGPKRVMFTLGELMPTSGGTGNTDPFARYGVGDGPEEVAGENAKAAGMVETDKMIEDNKDSLIDAVNDMYGQPHKPRKEQERLVAAGLAQVIENHGKLPDNRRPSRDFDTARQGPKNAKKPKSQGARSIFEVQGRTPLHIRVVAYEIYDSKEVRWLEAKRSIGRLIENQGGDWMAVGNMREVSWYAEPDVHRLKVANLKENLVPTPSHLTRFRINKVDRPDYYQWDYDGVLALAGRKKTPPGVVITTHCQTLDRDELPVDAFARTGYGGSAASQLGDVPEELQADIRSMADEWTRDLPYGPAQITAIIDRLKADYTLDPDANAPANHPAPVMWFLKDSRRGPDYQFATAATLLLRSLGYPARVSLGFYAAPSAFDSETDHTPVRATDLHFWPEVLLRDGHWLVLEPTPGYDVLPPLQTWGQWATSRWNALLSFVERHVVILVIALILLVTLIWKRHGVRDFVNTLLWRTNPGRTWQQAVLRSARVLDRRGRLAGHGRLPSQSLRDWFMAWPQDETTQSFLGIAEQALYAPNLAPPLPEAEVRLLCRKAVHDWPLRKFVSAQPGGSA